MQRRTSVEIYHKLNEGGILSERRLQIYNVLYEHGPLTANQVFESYLKPLFPENYRHNTHARCTELEEMGVIYEVAAVNCPVTGNMVALWDVTDQLPVKPERKQTNKERIAQLEAENASLKAENQGLRAQLLMKRFGAS